MEPPEASDVINRNLTANRTGRPRTPITAVHPLRWLTVISGLIFVVSPWLNALHLMRQNGNPEDYPGWPLLFFGWIGVFSVLDGKLDAVGWLANPCYALSAVMILLGERTVGVCWIAGAAAALSLASFQLKEVLMDEGGQTASVVGYDVGFWIWMTAIWLNFLTALLVWLFPVKAFSAAGRATDADSRATEAD